MTAPDPRLGEIEARLAEHYEDIAYADDIAEGGDEEVPEDYERHYCNEDGEDWPCPTIAKSAPADVAYLLAELRKRDDALATIRAHMADPEHYDTQGPSNGYVSVDNLRAAAAAAAGGGEK